jgi:hypothetical protein
VTWLSAIGWKNHNFIPGCVKSFASSPRSLEYTRPYDQWKLESLYPELKRLETEADLSPPFVAENKKIFITSSLQSVERAVTCASTYARYISHLSLYLICAHTCVIQGAHAHH